MFFPHSRDHSTWRLTLAASLSVGAVNRCLLDLFSSIDWASIGPYFPSMSLFLPSERYIIAGYYQKMLSHRHMTKISAQYFSPLMDMYRAFLSTLQLKNARNQYLVCGHCPMSPIGELFGVLPYIFLIFLQDSCLLMKRLGLSP